MTLCLQMNPSSGKTDHLVTPSMTFNKVVFSVLISSTQISSAYTLIDSRSGASGLYESNFFTGYSAKLDGVTNNNQMGTFTKDIKHTIELTPSATITSNPTIFARNNNTNFMSGNLYDIQFFNGATLVAHYDMSTGTVQDVSGNGNHATLTGGTWVDDGAGGGSTGTTGSTAFDLKQALYQTLSSSYDTRLQMYENGSYSFDSKQEVYYTDSLLFDLQQTIFNVSTSDYDTEQIVFNSSSTRYDTEQTIYKVASSLFDTLQQITDGGIIGSARFDTRMILYADGQSVYDTKQSMYQTDAENYDLKQAIYQAGQTDNDLKLVLFANSSTDMDLLQKIYNPNGHIDFDTLQSIFDPDKSIIGTIRLNGSQTLNVYLVGSQELNINLKGVI